MYKYCRYEAFLKTLPIDPQHDSFWLTKTNTCYVNGVFAARSLKETPRNDRILKYVKNKLHITTTERNYVTIIQRANRRLVNPEDMLETAHDVFGTGRARIVDLEKLSVTEQVSLRT